MILYEHQIIQLIVFDPMLLHISSHGGLARTAMTCNETQIDLTRIKLLLIVVDVFLILDHALILGNQRELIG